MQIGSLNQLITAFLRINPVFPLGVGTLLTVLVVNGVDRKSKLSRLKYDICSAYKLSSIILRGNIAAGRCNLTADGKLDSPLPAGKLPPFPENPFVVANPIPTELSILLGGTVLFALLPDSLAMYVGAAVYTAVIVVKCIQFVMDTAAYNRHKAVFTGFLDAPGSIKYSTLPENAYKSQFFGGILFRDHWSFPFMTFLGSMLVFLLKQPTLAAADAWYSVWFLDSNYLYVKLCNLLVCVGVGGLVSAVVLSFKDPNDFEYQCDRVAFQASASCRNNKEFDESVF